MTTWMRYPAFYFRDHRPGWHLMTHQKRGKDVCRYFYPRQRTQE